MPGIRTLRRSRVEPQPVVKVTLREFPVPCFYIRILEGHCVDGDRRTFGDEEGGPGVSFVVVEVQDPEAAHIPERRAILTGDPGLKRHLKGHHKTHQALE